MTWTAERVLAAWSEVARSILLKCRMPQSRNASCVSATRVAALTLERFGLRVEPMSVAWVVEVPACRVAWVCGLSPKERAEAERTAAKFEYRKVPGGTGWDGHLVLIVEDRWLVDSSFDACSMPQMGFSVPPTVLTMDLSGAGCHPRDAIVTATLTNDQGVACKVMYRPLDKDVWRNSEAWNDADLPAIADVIYAVMLKGKRGSSSQNN
jgi:hypothetical protein